MSQWDSQAAKALEKDRVSYEAVRRIIGDYIQRKKPMSLVRIGDGESVILDWPRSTDSEDLKEHLRLWFGSVELHRSTLKWLNRRLIRACSRARILGIPTPRQVSLHPRYCVSYRHLNILYKQGALKKGEICDAAIHRLLHLSGDLISFLSRTDFIGIISSRYVATQVQEAMNPRILAHYQIPGEHRKENDSRGLEWQWIPGGYNEIRQRIIIPYKGAVFLVGGGLMGKLLCDDIYRKGGIALDIGSVFDGWIQNDSRAYFKNYSDGMYSLSYASEQARSNEDARLASLKETLIAYERHPESLKVVEKDGAI